MITQSLQISESITIDLSPIAEVYDLGNEILFDTIKSELQTLKVVMDLVNKGNFKECFIILRAIFELMLYFWLMLEGEKYKLQHTYTIQPDPEQDIKTARDETYAKWLQSWKEKKDGYEAITHIQAIDTDKIRVQYEYEGLYEEKDKQKTGKIVPFYVFVLTDHYSQSLRFNAELPSIKAGDMFPDITENMIKDQKQLYHNYIYFEAILKNLLLNELITKAQRDYIIIHYNFLSRYVHPSIHAITQFTTNAKFYKRHDQYPDDIVKEQVLLYVARIICKLISITLKRFEKECNPIGVEKFKTLVSQLDFASSYFWFFDNEPLPFDKSVSEIKKNSVESITKKESEDLIIYYEDPIERLYNLKTTANR
ncbi:MAG: hypothetical protein LV477_02015 [Candidatus Nitrosotalea sp.]|nr:hypothetical protein [Candidatus Nitrosotalea sp.]